MKRYQTSQKQTIIDYLSIHPERQFTIEELSNELTGENGRYSSIGKSTIYRLMNYMMEEGIVRRMVKGNTKQFIYQYAGEEECSFHLHMKCLECGKVLHMNNKNSELIHNMLQDNNQFQLDLKDTLLMGTCGVCDIKENKVKR